MDTKRISQLPPIARCTGPSASARILPAILAAILALGMTGGFIACQRPGDPMSLFRKEITGSLGKVTLAEADSCLDDLPLTVTASFCPRSAGERHDYYSEGDYWWPDSANPGGPYVQKDGLSNPDNFQDHRLALRRFSQIVGTLTSAYLLTGEEKYVKAAERHLRAWFVDSVSRMNPHLLYSQAISGRVTGRGIGIIDGIFFIEIARSVAILERSPYTSLPATFGARQWFRGYLDFLTMHPYGKDERNKTNNHGTWWYAQAAVIAKLTGNQEVLEMCRRDFREVLLPGQMAADGSFPLETERTKPFGYSQFNLEGLTLLAWVLSTEEENLMDLTLDDGRGISRGMEFIAPYMRDKETWPYGRDVSYWDEQPTNHVFPVLAALAFHSESYLEIWENLDRGEKSEESKRNQPIKSPLLWIGLPDPYESLTYRNP